MSAQAEKWSEPKLIVDNDDALGAAANERAAATSAAQINPEAQVAPAAGAPALRWRQPALYLGIVLLLALVAGLLYFSKLPSIGRQALPVPERSSPAPAIAESKRATAAKAISDAQPLHKPGAPSRNDTTALVAAPSNLAASASAASGTGAAMMVPVAPTDGHGAIRLLEQRLDDALSHLHELAAAVQGLTSSDAQTRQQLAAINERLRRRTAARAEQKRAAQPNLATPASQPPSEPAAAVTTNASQLLAVDTWNGVASVSISRGGEIGFLSPGERTAEGMVLRSADPSRQQAVFGLPSGESIAHQVQP